MDELRNAARIALADCLGLQPHETLLILNDTPMARMARVFSEVGKELAREVVLLEYAPRELNGQEPPEPVPTTMTHVDVVLAITSLSVTHTAARRGANAAGARVATMPGITEDCLIRTMNADYRAIAARTERVRDRLTSARTARVTTELGTDIVLPIEGIAAIASTGLILKSGQFGNLPSGEAYMHPVEGASNGVIVVDGSLSGIGALAEPIRITVQNGLAVAVEGGAQAHAFNAQLEKAGPQARNVAELGVGTNDKAIVTGKILEDEKILGTVHIAFGNNASMGGSVSIPFHVDGILMNPTLTLDGEVILDRGTPLFE